MSLFSILGRAALCAGGAILMSHPGAGLASGESGSIAKEPAEAAQAATELVKPAPAPIIRKPTIAPKVAPLIKRGSGIRTPALQFTGTGKPLTGAALPTVAVRTPAMTFTGTGVTLVSRTDVGVNEVRTPALQFTGTGSIEP